MYQSYALADLVVNYVSRKPGLSQGQRLSHITPVTQSKIRNFPPHIALLCTSSTGGLLTPPLTNPLTLRLVIISFRPAWLARALLSFKRAQSSGND